MRKWISLLIILVFMISTPSLTFAASDNARQRVLANLVKNENWKGRILWYDLSANMQYLNTPEKVRNIIQKTADANIDTIVVDVKNYTGFVAYDSKIAPHISRSLIPGYDGYEEGYDLLAIVLEEAKKQGLEVLANVNVFSEGNNTYKDGPVFQHPEWQSYFYHASRLVEAQNGETHEINGVNTARLTNYLVLYTPDEYDVSPANQWGVEVQIVDGEITHIEDRQITGAGPLEVPRNGVLLSAHGTAREWVLKNLQVGQKIDYNKTETEIIPASEYPTYSVFVNPIREDVINYELSIIEEILTNYDVDGIVLDRARYSDLFADFSDLSREKFEEYIGQQVQNWPEDIFKIEFEGTAKNIVEGPLYKKWIEFRAHNIQSFFKKAEKLVHSIDEDLLFTTYVGSWYPLYYNEGVNWGSKTYKGDYEWASEDYHKTGYAEYLDFIMTGNYYPDVTVEETDAKGLPYWYSVEGSAQLAMEAINYATFNYGSLYLNQYKDNPEQFRKAIRAVEKNTHGIMLFDLVYLEQFGWWDIVREEFSRDTKPPHQNPGFLKMVRADNDQ